MKKRLFIFVVFLFVVVMGTSPALATKPDGFDNNGNATGQLADTGFDQYGYNYVARIFSGTADGVDRNFDGTVWGDSTYANDLLVMKWNAEWDRGNAENWSDSTYDAWENNEWNGMVAGGSGSVWHYKIVWVGPCDNYTYFSDGGYCIWNQFEVIMDQGIDPAYGPGHIWYAHAIPTGYGAYP